LIDGGANYLSGIDPSVSFNGGSNFSAVSNGSWTVVANSGTSYVFDWVQSGTYGSGLCGGNVLKSIAFMYD